MISPASPISMASSRAQGFSATQESGPHSTTNPSRRTVSMIPPRRCVASYSTNSLPVRASSYAAERPAIPPPIIAVLMMQAAPDPAARYQPELQSAAASCSMTQGARCAYQAVFRTHGRQYLCRTEPLCGRREIRWAESQLPCVFLYAVQSMFLLLWGQARDRLTCPGSEMRSANGAIREPSPQQRRLCVLLLQHMDRQVVHHALPLFSAVRYAQ